MNLTPIAVCFVGLLLCGCSVIETSPSRPIEESKQLSVDWESASIEQHALILTPLKIADNSPDIYRKAIESSKHTRDEGGREILSVSKGETFPEHEFILDRAAGKFETIVKFDLDGVLAVTSSCVRRMDGWHHTRPSITLNQRAEQDGDRQSATCSESK